MKNKEKICCEHCRIELERQLLGSNVFYYCNECGKITSAKDMVTSRTHENKVKACV